MGWLEFLSGVITLVVLIFKEYLSRDAREKKEQAEVEARQKVFDVFVEKALLKLRAQSAKDSAGAGSAWDQADKEQGKNGPDTTL